MVKGIGTDANTTPANSREVPAIRSLSTSTQLRESRHYVGFWSIPSTRRQHILVDLLRPPRMRLIYINRCLLLKHRINDPPRLLHIDLTRKERRIPNNR